MARNGRVVTRVGGGTVYSQSRKHTVQCTQPLMGHGRNALMGHGCSALMGCMAHFKEKKYGCSALLL